MIVVDIETRSKLDLKKHGLANYAAEAEVIIFCALDMETGEYKTMASLDEDVRGLPEYREFMLANAGKVFCAHNANFERQFINADRWYCTMNHALSLSLPASLKNLSSALGLSEDERKLDGNALIRKFCIPHSKAAPKAGDWEAFIEYCKRDVQATYYVAQKLAKYPQLQSELELQELDFYINNRGLPINRDRAIKLRELALRIREDAENELKRLTEIDNPNSNQQMLAALAANGLYLGNMRKETIAAELNNPRLSDTQKRILQLRQLISSSSLKKLDMFINHAKDGRVRHCFQYCGAGKTGRWAGRNTQPQNLPRPTVEVDNFVKEIDNIDVEIFYNAAELNQLLVSSIRSIICHDKPLVIYDFASIESVILGWAAESKPLLNIYKRNKDAYKVFACELFGVSYEQVTKQQRSISKPAVLGCGYGLGAKGLSAYAGAFGVQLSEQEAYRHMRTFRGMFPEVVNFWDAVEDAFLNAMGGEPGKVGKFKFDSDRNFTWIGLPSGRRIYYFKPKFNGRDITFLSGGTGGLSRIKTYGACLVENLVQALARDVLADAMLRIDRAGVNIAGHVHDEVIAEGGEDIVKDIMNTPPVWAADAPISAEGFTSYMYKKG